MRPKSCQKLSFQKADIPLLLQFLSQVLERVCPDLNCAHYWQSALKCTHSLPLAGSLPLTSSHCINLRRKPFKQDMAKRGGVAKGEASSLGNRCKCMRNTSASLHTNSKETHSRHTHRTHTPRHVSIISIHSRRSTFTLNLPSLCCLSFARPSRF